MYLNFGFFSNSNNSTFFLVMPPDGEGRGGPDPLQGPQGEAGQRILPTT